jgi:pectate lyase
MDAQFEGITRRRFLAACGAAGVGMAAGCLTAAGTGGATPARLAFPGAEGFGAKTPGGRGGQVIRVTTLAARGPGSIGEALAAKGPRIVVFEVGGVIDLGRKAIKVEEPFLTIAGQTAPAPGITIIKGSLAIAAHDLVIRHIRVRPGEAGRPKKSGWEPDGISTGGAANVVIDHCSCTWAVDENLSASGPRFDGANVDEWRLHTSHNITFSNCIIAECLSNSTHGKGEHSKGTLIHDNATAIAIIGNLYASNADRNPLAKGGVQAAVVNNWISNPGRAAIGHGLVVQEWGEHPHVASRMAVVGNCFEYGADTREGMALMTNRNGPLELFMDDNLAFDRDRKPAPMVKGEFTKVDERPLWPEGLKAAAAKDVKELVAKTAGARPWDRDAIDQRIVRAALDGKGKIINSQDEAGGYPDIPATQSPFKPEEWDMETLEAKKTG